MPEKTEALKKAGILRNTECFAHDLDAGLLVVVCGLDFLQGLRSTKQSDAAARHDAFLNRGAGRVHRVINAILALLHLDFGLATDADHRNAARELGQTLLQLLTVVVRSGFLDLRLDLRNACLDVGECRSSVGLPLDWVETRSRCEAAPLKRGPFVAE